MLVETLSAELERLFELPDLTRLSRDALGFEPSDIGGVTTRASFARAGSTSLSTLPDPGVMAQDGFEGTLVAAVTIPQHLKIARSTRRPTKPYRYRPDAVRDEVLARMLDLNQKRYQEQVAAGLHGKLEQTLAARPRLTQARPRIRPRSLGARPRRSRTEHYRYSVGTRRTSPLANATT